MRPPKNRPQGTRRPRPFQGPRPEQKPTRPEAAAATHGRYWMYGRHAVAAALAHAERPVHRLWLTATGEERLGPLARKVPVQRVESDQLHRLLGEDAVDQGIAAEVSPLDGAALEDVLATAPAESVLLVLDQVTDPHNVGAILRSAAAFGAVAIMLARDHAPPETATMAKTSCGALEQVPMVHVANLVRALEQAKQAGFWVVGMEGEATTALHAHKLSGKVALVLGAEGKGLRRLTLEACDLLAHLPIRAQMESLNVSNAAAIALYELCARRDAGR